MVNEDRIAAVRAFNRFYTNVIGVLEEGLLDSPYSLTEARVIFELAQRETTDVGDLRRELAIDAGYLSRILARFEVDGLVKRERSSEDARRQTARLTRSGRAAYRRLNSKSEHEIGALLEPLAEPDGRRLTDAMRTIAEILGEGDANRQREPYVLRAPEPGDYGWVVERHGALYAQDYDWDETFEALVARIVADYVDDHDGRRERVWIAERDGERAGCVFCVKGDSTTARLRLLLVEPSARGAGLGSALVDECVRFATRARYTRLVLWTNHVLTDARRIYERAGFELMYEERHHSFGHDLVGQTWSRGLARSTDRA